MVYFLRPHSAALGRMVEDVYTQNRWLWAPLREKDGKRHPMPCHHNLEEYLTLLSRRHRAAERCQKGRCSATASSYRPIPGFGATCTS
jgi:hypothetical protein